MDYSSFLDDIIKGVKEEDQELEFKSSFFALPNSKNFNGKDYDDKVLNRLISFQCVKAIIGLMNSNGGHLVIGVSDDLNESYMRNLFNILSFKETNISEDEFRSKFTDIFIDGTNPFLSEEEFINHLDLTIVSYNPKIKIGIVKVKKYTGNKGVIIINDYQKVIETNHSGRFLEAIFQRVGNKTKSISSPKKIFDLVSARIQNSSQKNTPQNQEETISSSNNNVINFKSEQNKIKKNNEDTFLNPFKSGKDAKKIISQFFEEDGNNFQYLVNQALNTLPNIEQESFKKRWTLKNNKIYRTYFWSIGDELGVNENTARKYYNDALSKLKDIKISSNLKSAIAKFSELIFYKFSDQSEVNEYIKENLTYENEVYELIFGINIETLIDQERKTVFSSLFSKFNSISHSEKEIILFSRPGYLFRILGVGHLASARLKMFCLRNGLDYVGDVLSKTENDFTKLGADNNDILLLSNGLSELGLQLPVVKRMENNIYH